MGIMRNDGSRGGEEAGKGSGSMGGEVAGEAGGPIARRDFLRVAGASAAGAGLWIGSPLSGSLVTPPGTDPGTSGGAEVTARAVTGAVGGDGGLLASLGNGEPPALQFHAHPGGTGALLEELWRDTGGAAFARTPIQVTPWVGAVPSDPEVIAFLPVHRLAVLIRDRHLSSVDLTEIYLERLERHDPRLLCAVTILGDRARAEAREADAEIAAGGWRGPLHGIPYGLKDLFSTPGAPTTWGAEEFRDRVIDEESEVAVRLRAAGAVLMAKLTTGRYARGDGWFGGRTRNPWNPEQGSSGSSAGPASATVAGLVGFGIGTETQGSIVSPARRCGVSALRPTFGRVSRQGGMVLAWTMDKVGPIARTVEDCALVFHAIHGADPKDPSTLTAPFRFARPQNLSGIRIGFTEDAPETFLDELRSMGAEITAMPDLPRGGSSALTVESAAAFDYLVADEEGEPGEPDQRDGNRFLNGRSVLAFDHLQSQRNRYLLMRDMARAMESVDMFVSGSGEVGLTNQTGHPAVIVPYAMREGDNPQPLCTTIIGHPFGDDAILSVAHAYQQVTGWHRRHPELG